MAIVALISSSLSPLMAATACMGTGKAMSCHAAEKMANCDRHMHEHHHSAAPAKSDSSMSVAEDNSKCPMDCCSPGHLTTVAKPSAASFLPPLAVSTRSIHFASVTFVSAGFSSHTDRGPPLS
jgi:hypothetical protein